MRLDKIKVPAGTFSYEFDQLGEDAYGFWLVTLPGARWVAPHDRGSLPMAVLVLVSPEMPFVTWWVGEADDRRLQIDVCVRPERTPSGWSYRDLELDLVRHEPERIDVEDADEFEAACKAGSITQEERFLAETTVIKMRQDLEQRTEPWGDEGWYRLDTLL